MTYLKAHFEKILKYDTWELISNNIGEITYQWDKFSYLDGVDSDLKSSLSSWYQLMMIKYFKKEEYKKLNLEEIIPFVVIRRIFQKIMEHKDSELFEKMKENFNYVRFEDILKEMIIVENELIPIFKKLFEGEKFDYEAEGIAQYCSLFVNKLKSQTEDNLTKHESRKRKIMNVTNKKINYFELIPE